MEETPPTEFDATTTHHEEIVVSIEKAFLNKQHFLDEHIQLIFECIITWRTNSTIRSSAIVAWTSCSNSYPVQLPRSTI
jgi:hypothetical protein